MGNAVLQFCNLRQAQNNKMNYTGGVCLIFCCENILAIGMSNLNTPGIQLNDMLCYNVWGLGN